MFYFFISLNSLWFFFCASFFIAGWFYWKQDKMALHCVRYKLHFDHKLIVTLYTFYANCFYKIHFDWFYFSLISLVIFLPCYLYCRVIQLQERILCGGSSWWRCSFFGCGVYFVGVLSERLNDPIMKREKGLRFDMEKITLHSFLDIFNAFCKESKWR